MFNKINLNINFIKHIKKILMVFFICLIFVVFVVFSKTANKLIEFSGETMGTYYTIKYSYDKKTIADYFNSANSMAEIKQKINNYLISFNNIVSHYQMDSDISRFNQAKAFEKIKVDPVIIELIDFSVKISDLTYKVFDPTISNLIDAWGFGAKSKSDNLSLPLSKDQVNKLLFHTGLDKIIIYKNDQMIAKTNDALELNFSAIAKGYAVQQISNILIDNSYANHYVDIGGEIYVSGEKNKKPWIIGIPTPDISMQDSKTKTVLKLKNQCISTSGDYLNYAHDKNNAKIYSHIIDPRTGFSIEHNGVSVSVVHKDCAYADALSTSFLILGPEQAIMLAKKLKLAVLFIIKNSKKNQINANLKHSKNTYDLISTDKFKKLLVSY